MAYINGEANTKCCNCKAAFNRMDMVYVPDEESTKKWGVKTNKLTCPYCGHDEYQEFNV